MNSIDVHCSRLERIPGLRDLVPLFRAPVPLFRDLVPLSQGGRRPAHGR